MLSNDGRGICPTKPDTGPLKIAADRRHLVLIIVRHDAFFKLDKIQEEKLS